MKRWLVVSLLGAAACGKSDPRPVPSSARDSALGSAATGSAASGSGSAATAPHPLEPPVAVAAPAGPYRGPDCRAAHAPRPDRDAAPMCFQPGGTFLVGSPDGEGTPAERPQRRVTLSPYFIDQFEVTTAQFARFLNEAAGVTCEVQDGDEVQLLCGATRSDGSSGPIDSPLMVDIGAPDAGRARYSPRAGQERFPISLVAPLLAREYCAWVGKMLPTEFRWEYAARVEPLTGAVRRHPWGDANEPRFLTCGRGACYADGGFPATPVDDYPLDVSATGVRGLATGVSEIVAGCPTASQPDCGTCIDPPAPSCGDLSVIRGDYSEAPGGRASAAARDSAGIKRTTEVSTIGFRCAADAVTAR